MKKNFFQNLRLEKACNYEEKNLNNRLWNR